ncbi:hypothetical protein KIF53_16375 [Chromobacterium subtsugae]|uniref:Adhesin domain-containing protein n=2 Tax=Chromobacterium subtsugae TaxID=251747 RepID=A0ABS7FGM3_9NEIS|nr:MULTISPECIES: hypothetical protein [Chromobacterium]KZE86359.1 hypothetical protein AWB61_16255 [Chromobacterium sp. F49]MBW7567985.1 hypothetical protein [Chromobacterium subtsugae]MBW8289212.1 hypothetical protein [Chromobacterium subtsugae]OBU86465.1 hypothetical protein MY55_09765 [Chromobacterium subtsugae]WSE92694.1 hypothetical protein U6115_05405 [Chromobacterium subtsugae]
MMDIAKTAACLLLIGSGAARAEEAGNIDRLIFRGDAARLELTADAAKPYKLSLEKRNWSDADCKVAATRQGGDLTFRIDLGAVAAERCRLVIRGNVKPGKKLDVDLKAVDGDVSGRFDQVQMRGQALHVDLNGEYGAVRLSGEAVKSDVKGQVGELRLKGNAVNLDFDGASRAVALDGQAIKADIALQGAQPAASVDVNGQMVKLEFTGSKAAKLDYQVSGQASKVSGDWANTPGAPLKLRVKGQAVKVSLEQN